MLEMFLEGVVLLLVYYGIEGDNFILLCELILVCICLLSISCDSLFFKFVIVVLNVWVIFFMLVDI